MTGKDFSAFAADMATTFWNAMKETPGQMAAPFVAAWRETVKLATPEEPNRKKLNGQASRHLRPER